MPNGNFRQINNRIKILKNEQSGVMFGTGSKYDDQVRIFVRKDELAIAQPIVDAYLKEIGE